MRMEPKFLADFLRYSKRVMSSSGPKKFKNSFSAPGLCGIRKIRYFFKPANLWALSFTSGNRSKSKLPPEVTHTTRRPLIACPKSCSASTARAPAGSSTMPSTFNMSNIEIHILSSGIVITFANPILRRRLNVFSPILPTAAPSANVFTVSSLVGFPLISASRRQAPPKGSTRVYVHWLPK